MKNKLFGNKADGVLHIVGWLIAIVLPLYISPFYTNLPANLFPKFALLKTLSDIIIIAFFYYNFLYLAPEWIKTKNTFRFIAIGIIIYILLFVFEILFFKLFIANTIDLAYKGATLREFLPMPKIFGLLFYYVAAFIISTAMALNKHHQYQHERQKQIEFEKLKAELEVLKLQISPHFLFNTLNNIRSLIRKKSDKTEDIVIKLSNILRYIIYQSNSEKVLLNKEIEHLQDYIVLQKLRIRSPENVMLEIVGNTENVFIEPLMFIPFVENAFKYGIDAKTDSIIHFLIKVENEILYFESNNQRFELEYDTEQNSGIGIKNVSKRLQLYYPNKHQLLIEATEKQFLVKMKIELN